MLRKESLLPLSCLRSKRLAWLSDILLLLLLLLLTPTSVAPAHNPVYLPVAAVEAAAERRLSLSDGFSSNLVGKKAKNKNSKDTSNVQTLKRARGVAWQQSARKKEVSQGRRRLLTTAWWRRRGVGHGGQERAGSLVDRHGAPLAKGVLQPPSPLRSPHPPSTAARLPQATARFLPGRKILPIPFVSTPNRLSHVSRAAG